MKAFSVSSKISRAFKVVFKRPTRRDSAKELLSFLASIRCVICGLGHMALNRYGAVSGRQMNSQK
jgi:hypothetical protein